MKTISYKELTQFSWPPKMMSYKPKERKKYRHEVLVIGKSDPDTALVLTYNSPTAAREARRSIEKADNILSARYEKIEVSKEIEGFRA